MRSGFPKQLAVSTYKEDYDNLRKQIRESLGDSAVQVSGNTEMIVLTGSAKSVDESKRAGALATTFSKKVTNLIKTPPPAELRQIMLEVKPDFGKVLPRDRCKLNFQHDLPQFSRRWRLDQVRHFL